MKKRTFTDIVNSVRETNSEVLWKKARLANRLAKRRQAGRTSRSAAYSVKSKALLSLVNYLPEHVKVSPDIKFEHLMIVEHKDDYSGLHLPISHLA